MKIEVNKNKLIKVISKADKVVSKNSTLPVLSCILLETESGEIFVKATNLEIGLKIKLEGKILEEGKTAIPSNLFNSYISNLGGDEELTIELKENVLFITSSKSETKINTLSTEDFPDIPDTTGAKSCKVPSKELVEGLKGVWYAASTSNMKPELSSVYIYSESGNLCFVSTDSFRLAEKKIKVKTEDFPELLIPQRNVLEVVRIFEDLNEDVYLKFEEDKVSFEVDGKIHLITRVIDGNFPDYKQIIPTKVNLLKNDLQNTLKISNVFSNNFNQVNFIIDSENKTLEILSKNAERGESRNTISCSAEGESLEINFNQKYINDCFVSLDSESVELNFSGQGKPMIIKGVNDESFQYLVMPLNK
jgi:DNA polymerase-3 subunit beta